MTNFGYLSFNKTHIWIITQIIVTYVGFFSSRKHIWFLTQIIVTNFDYLFKKTHLVHNTKNYDNIPVRALTAVGAYMVFTNCDTFVNYLRKPVLTSYL